MSPPHPSGGWPSEHRRLKLADRVDSDVLVVGAGPVGLTLALQARVMGASVRIVDRLPRPRDWAPALAVHPRTLEILRGLGVADRLIARSVAEVALEIHFPGSVVGGRLHHLTLPETEFPFILFAPQPEVEAVLRERLLELGVEIEWGTEVVDVDIEDGIAVSELTTGAGTEKLRARYVGGCDGAESAVRRSLGIPFPGRRYRQSIVVADVEATSELSPRTAHAFPRDGGLLFLFPLPSGEWRLIGPSRGHMQSVAGLVATHTRGSLRVDDVRWVKEIVPQHRIATRYRRGPVFLAGDAAHVHSPAGAQGMNTGIQDAANPGWKLALGARGAPDSLLASYETERRPVARQVLHLTGLASTLEVSEALPLRMARKYLAKPVASVLLPRPRLTSIFARVVSGLDTRYRKGAIGESRSGHLKCRPGGRLPDVVLGDGSRLHDVIDAASFHLLVSHDLPLPTTADDWLRIHSVNRKTMPVGADQVLVRPDGHVAICGVAADRDDLDDYVRAWIGSAAPEVKPAPNGPPGTRPPLRS